MPFKTKKQPIKVAPVASAPKPVDALKDVRDFYAKNGHLPTVFANESKRLYGTTGNAKLYSDLGIQVARGKMTKAQALAQIRNGSGIDDIHRRAGDAVNVELNPQIDEYNRQATSTQQAADQQITQNQRDTDAYAQSVAQLYSRLGERLNAGNQKVQAGWQQAQQGTAKNYDELQSALAQVYGAQTQDVNDFAAKLNLSGADAATAQMGADQKFLQGLFGGQKQSAVDMLVANGLIDLQEGTRFGQAQQAAGGSYQAQARADNLRNTENLRGETSRTVQDLLGRAGSLEATRGARLRENITALEEGRAQAQSEAEANAFDRQIALAKLQLEQSQYGLERDYKMGSLDVARQNANISQQRVNIEAKKTTAQLQKEARALDPTSLEYAEKMAAIDLKRSQTKKNIADYTAAPKTPTYAKGMVGAQQYLMDTLGDPSIANVAAHEVTLAMQYGSTYQDAIRRARANFAKFTDLKDPTLQSAILNALDLAWTGNKNPPKPPGT
jgi:hypothetical protein